jgi:hypothetical protein
MRGGDRGAQGGALERLHLGISGHANLLLTLQHFKVGDGKRQSGLLEISRPHPEDCVEDVPDFSVHLRVEFFHLFDDVVDAQEHYDEWKKLDEGQRVNYIIKEMKELYPKVDAKIWYILNAILWVGATYLKKTGLSFSITDLKMLKGK